MAKKSIICAIAVILVILISISTRLGPSSWKIDNLQGDQNFTRHKLNLPNCRKNKTSRVTGYKKLMLGNRKDPTWYGFLRYRGIGPTIEDQLIYDRNKYKTYCSNLNDNRISIVMSYYENPSPLLGIPYEILMDCKNNNMKKFTSQNENPTTQPSTVALGIRIRGLNFVLKNNCSIFFCFSAIMLYETKISGKSATVKKRWCVIEFNESLNSDGNMLSRGPTIYGINIKEIGNIHVQESLVKNSSVFFTNRFNAKFVLVEKRQEWLLVTTLPKKNNDWVLKYSKESIYLKI